MLKAGGPSGRRPVVVDLERVEAPRRSRVRRECLLKGLGRRNGRQVCAARLGDLRVLFVSRGRAYCTETPQGCRPLSPCPGALGDFMSVWRRPGMAGRRLEVFDCTGTNRALVAAIESNP